ncbi:DUF4184 family protein [uncultured Psychrobacter sp.]|uniref:DUF4184 family protein n=1 Tax=uncultured Psychrobacter sp. TaxID=259303 RepID=UPI003458772D
MAFTISHMAAALPFYPARRWLQFDALLIGTMMPDMPYYTGIGNPNGNFSHQWIGVFAYCLPWGIVVFALWYWGLKPAAYALVEPFLEQPSKGHHYQPNQSHRYITGYTSSNYRSIKGLMQGSGRFYLSVVLGLVLGAVTHIIWDGITHEDGLIASHIDWLQYRVYFYPFKGTTVARLLQYLSSLAGLAVLLWFAFSRLQTWQRNSHRLDRQFAIFHKAIRPIFTKKQSLLIVVLMIVLSLVWFVKAVVKWYPSLIGSPYNLAARVSVVVSRDIIILCVGYAVIYHGLRFLRYINRKHRRH